jgi:ketosteroid isomerase-like protein
MASSDIGLSKYCFQFEKAFNAGDLDTLLKLYDEQSVLVAEPGKPVQGLDNIKRALMGPIQLTVRRMSKK